MLKLGEEPIPGYRLTRFLGKGGFGEVWEAEGEYGVRKALKFLDVRGKLGLKEYRGIRRVKDIRSANLMQITDIWMLDENWHVLQADEAAKLDSHVPNPTNTVRVDQVAGDLKQPAVLVVGMTLGDKSLEARLEECIAEHGGGIPLDELLDHMEGAAKGIDFLNLHKHETDDGFVTIQHCDIKPANMMLVGNSVVICDFGLAHVLRDQQIEATAAAGAPPYISPEMLTTQKPTPTTDQYSLACSYFHLRTGVLPFGSSTSVQQLFLAHKEGRLDFSAIRGPRERSVLKRATSVTPTKRYDSCAVFVKELRKAIDEDVAIEEVYAREKWRIRLRRTAIAAVVILLLGLIGYGIYKPEPFRHAWQTLVGIVKGDSKSEGGNGSPNNGNGKKGNGDVSPVKPPPPDTTPRQLIADADGKLEKEPAEAEVLYSQALQALTPQDDTSLRRRATLGQARANARLQSPNWGLVQGQLDALKEVSGEHSPAEDCVVAILQTLAAEARNPASFFSEDVLAGLAHVAEAKGWTQDADKTQERNNQWEAGRLEPLKLRVVGLVEQRFGDPEIEQWFKDPRFQKIFEGQWDIWRIRLRAQRLLLSGDVIAPDERKQLEADLRDAMQKVEEGSAKERVAALLALLQLRNGGADLLETSAAFPGGLADPELQTAFCQALLDQLEQRVVVDQIQEPVLTRCQELIEKLPSSNSAPQTPPPAQRLLAVTTVNRLWASDFDYERVLADCQQLRGTGTTLPESIQRLVDACWLEATIVKSGATPSASIQEIVAAVASYQAEKASLSNDFLAYVLAREMRVIERRAASEILSTVLGGESGQVTLDALKARAFMRVETRRAFCGALLVDAAEELREKSQAPLQTPAYSTENADYVIRCLSLAVNDFGVPPQDCCRNLALADYYASQPNYADCYRYSELLQLDPAARDDGQTLFVRASAWKNRDGAGAGGQPSAATVYGDYLVWHARYRADAGGWELYRQIVEPALQAVKTDEDLIRNMHDTSKSVEVSADLPPSLRPSLARIFATSAGLVADDYDTVKNLFGDDRGAAIKHRYVYFRSAAALAPEEIDFVIGQYWAVRDWTDREYSKTVEEMDRLSTTAYALNPEVGAANAMMGESLVAKSRLEPNKAQQRDMLKRAIEVYFEKALGVPGLKDRPEFLVLRSTAYVEYAFLMNEEGEKLKLLQKAVSDAQAARRSVADWNKSLAARAALALGNAAEDIAYYCRFEPEQFYRTTLEAFGYSPGNEPNMPGVLATGRARYRRALQIHYNYFNPTDKIVVPDEVDTAIEELESAREKLQQGSDKAEACFFLGSAWDLKAQLVADETARNAAAAAAEEAFRSAIDLSNELSWQVYQTFWARRAVLQRKYPDAIERATKVLEEHASGTRVVSWPTLYHALETMFLATPLEARQRLIAEKLGLLPADNPTAVVYRFWWLMLYADQWMGVEVNKDQKSFLRADDPLLSGAASATVEGQLDSYVEYAEKSRQLCESLKAVDLEAQDVKVTDLAAYAALAVASVRYRQWLTSKNENSLGVALEALGEAADPLKNPSVVTFPSGRSRASLEELAWSIHMWYGAAAETRAENEPAKSAARTAIARTAAGKLEAFQKNCKLPSGYKRAISDLAKSLKSLE